MNIRSMCGALLALSMAAGSQAAEMTSSFSHLHDATWQVDLSFTNNGPSTGLTELTVYFGELSFANLATGATPAAWEPLVIQRDMALPAAGFVDYTLFDPSRPLGLGQQADFSVQFSYLGAGIPGSLRYEGYDANFNRLFDGQTISAIPEPSTGLLMAAGLGLVGFGVARRRSTGATTGAPA